MASPAGLINGTQCLLVKQLSSGIQQVIGALISDSSAFNRALIETTTKSSNEFRDLLTGDNGTKSVDHSCECYYSTDAAYQAMRAAYYSGEIGTYLFVYNGAESDLFDFKVESFSDSNNLNEAVKSSFALKSSDSFSIDVLFEQLTTNDDQSLSTNNDVEIYVKVP